MGFDVARRGPGAPPVRRLHAGARLPAHGRHRHRVRRAHGADQRPPARRRPRAHRRDPPPRRPLRRALPRDRRLLHRHEAAREARPGARPRPAPHPPRRADERPRPRGPRRDARLDPPHRHASSAIAIIISSHLLSEIERVCDHLVEIEGGRLVRSAPDGRTHGAPRSVLVVEVEGDSSAARRSASRDADWRVTRDERPLSSWSSRKTTPSYDLIRDSVVELGLGLVRLEQSRRRLEELFRARTLGGG